MADYGSKGAELGNLGIDRIYIYLSHYLSLPNNTKRHKGTVWDAGIMIHGKIPPIIVSRILAVTRSIS
jgi:hypothetical protein